MGIGRRVLVRLLVVVFALTVAAPFGPVKTAKAAEWCWCTQFLVNQRGLVGSYGHAYTWDDSGGFLTQNGYHQVSTPEVNDIVVYSETRLPSYGHVGIIKAVESTRLQVLGANQGGTTFEKANCSNVSRVWFVRRTYGETYWRR
jgi:surface antigen